MCGKERPAGAKSHDGGAEAPEGRGARWASVCVFFRTAGIKLSRCKAFRLSLIDVQCVCGLFLCESALGPQLTDALPTLFHVKVHIKISSLRNLGKLRLETMSKGSGIWCLAVYGHQPQIPWVDLGLGDLWIAGNVGLPFGFSNYK